MLLKAIEGIIVLIADKKATLCLLDEAMVSLTDRDIKLASRIFLSQVALHVA